MKVHSGVLTQKMERDVDPYDEEGQSELPNLYSTQPPAIGIRKQKGQ